MRNMTKNKNVAFEKIKITWNSVIVATSFQWLSIYSYGYLILSQLDKITKLSQPVLMKFQIYIISVHVGTLSLATVHTIDCLVSSRFTRHNLGAPWILKSLQLVRRPVTKNARHGPYDRNTTSLKFSRRDFFLREGVTCYENGRHEWILFASASAHARSRW